MKNLILLVLIFTSAANLLGQAQPRSIENQVASDSTTKFRFGEGLKINYQDKSYDGKIYTHQFTLGGNVATGYLHDYNNDNKNHTQAINMQRARFNLGGQMYDGKFGFYLQMDFTDAWALLDAYASYSPGKNINFSFGQKLINTNNADANAADILKEFIRPSLLTSELSGEDRREFGAFLDARFSLGSLVVKPSVSVTSGDGRNAFGAAGTYFDEGGLKYGTRIDFLPLGDFAPGNCFVGADLAHEESLKLAIGLSGSVNQGANHPIGDGHMYWDTEHPLYNVNGDVAYANYLKSYADVLIKYKGFSFAGEFGQAIASSYKNLFTDPQATIAIAPGRIGSYYVLTKGINIQSGYVMKNGLGIAVRYSTLIPEFETASLAVEKSNKSLALSKYFMGNKLKLQAEFGYSEFMPGTESSTTGIEGAMLLQAVF